jgi:hypothetical protein
MFVVVVVGAVVVVIFEEGGGRGERSMELVELDLIKEHEEESR